MTNIFTMKSRLDKALESPNHEESVLELAKELRDEGVSQIGLYFLYTEYQQLIDSDDPRYDSILDTLDLIYGGPWAKGYDLFESPLTKEIISAESR